MARGLFHWCPNCGNWCDLKPNGQPNHYECEKCKNIMKIPVVEYLARLRKQHGLKTI